MLLKELQSLGLSVELLHEEAEQLDLDDLDEEVYQNGDAKLEAVPALEFVEDTFPPVEAPVDEVTSSSGDESSGDNDDAGDEDASSDESEEAEEEDAASEEAEEIVTGDDN